jgi:hypothetical protein
VRKRSPGPSHRPGIEHPKVDEHSGSAPDDLLERISVPARARNHRLITVAGTLTREQYYRGGA